ncbi:MAG TPA: hypothetical protein DEH78_12270 [Solibacterales bacterium]|nr:hypothetical protein [Bryobacterales bacterium]
MPAQVERHLIRIAFDMANPGVAVVDKLSGETPQFWRGNDVRFEVVVMRNGAVLDVGNLASLTLEVRDDQNITSTPLMQKTVASGAMDNSVTDETWENDTKQHATFDFTDTETNLASPGGVYLGNWEDPKFIVLSGITSGGNVITYQAGKIIFREDGAGSAGTPPTNDPNYYTQAQVDAGFVQKTGATMTGLLVLSADPSAALGAATKQYVDAATSNGAWKKPVRVASTANVDIASAPASIDGVTLANGDRVLLKDQTSGLQNGIRVFTAAGAALNRSSDCNSSALCEPGFCVRVNEGTVNADRAFALTTNATITLDTTALTFTQVSALGQVTVAAGLEKTSNEALGWHASTHATPAGVSLNTAGTAGAPAITRVGDLNTGRFYPAADTIADATGGVERTRLTDTGLGIHMTPTKALDVTGEAEVTSRVRALGFETATPGIQVLDAQVATITSNNLPFPNDGQILQVAAGTVNTVSNVRAGALYLIVATGAVTLTDSATIVCRDGNVVLAADEAVIALGLSPTKVAIVGQTNGHRVASGSAAAPAIFFDAETTTGLFRSAAGIFGFAFSGTERMKLGIVSNNVEQIIPTYNFVIDPVDTTAGRGNLGLFGQRTFDGTGKQVVAWKSGTAPAGNLADAVQLWVTDRDATAGEASLHIRTEGGDLHLLGDMVGFFTHDPSHLFDVQLGAGVSPSAAFISDSTSGHNIYSANYSASAAYGTFVMRKARGTQATPAAINTNDVLGSVVFEGHNGSDNAQGGSINMQAAENWSGTNQGCELTFFNTAIGASGTTLALKLDSYLNALWYGAARPTDLAKGHVLANGTAPSVNPTNAIAFWSASGIWQYRSSAANEGAGQTNYVHNRTAQVEGTGTNYTLTNSTARVDFGTQDAEVTLPTAGTYVVDAILTVLADASGAGDEVRAKLYNSTDAADASQIMYHSCSGNSRYDQIHLRAVITVTAAKTIQIYAHNATSARGTVVSTSTNIRYSRMH